jgi:hypothetical protein
LPALERVDGAALERADHRLARARFSAFSDEAMTA